MSDLQRLSKLMSNRGMCSRREADALIEQGLVKVDGETVNTLGIKFPADVKIELTTKGQQQQQQRITIMLNKPVGHVSGQAEDDYVPAIRLFTKENRSAICRSEREFHPDQWQGLAPAGRLDIDSQGLLVLTQDGRIANEIINPDTKFDKEYLVRFEGSISENAMEKMRFGISLDGKALKPAKVRELNEDQLQIILTEGKKRQIRRMCDAVGLKVIGLKRVRIGELRLGKLEEGEWRYVEGEEFRHRSSAKERAEMNDIDLIEQLDEEKPYKKAKSQPQATVPKGVADKIWPKKTAQNQPPERAERPARTTFDKPGVDKPIADKKASVESKAPKTAQSTNVAGSDEKPAKSNPWGKSLEKIKTKD